MNKRWFVYAKKADFQKIAARFGIDQVTARILRNRDIVEDEEISKFLYGSLKDLYDPALLGGILDAAKLVAKKIREGHKIRVIGDYDIDGVCAACVLVDGLRRLGARVDYDIPDRMRDGYGLHIRMVEEAFAQGVDTLITCDNGISALEEIARAKHLGMTVIVTDHHQAAWHMEGTRRIYDLPPADAIIDPHLPADPYPFPDICGCVVAWKFLQVLAKMQNPDVGEDMKQRYLDLACFATVGDVMDLRDENRLIVRLGLQALSCTQNLGLKALIEECQLQGRTLQAYHIGFVLGPCINAGGRLKNAHIAARLLLSTDPKEAAALARELSALNEERKEMTLAQVEEAKEQIRAASWRKDPVYVLYLPNCHESIAGIVAGKVREETYHPVFVLTNSKEAGMLKGSGRSIEGYHMYDALNGCAHLLTQFGGHPMAAGLSLKRSHLDRLRKALNARCTLKEQDLTEKLMIDMQMPLGYLSEALVEELKRIEPCGKGNQRPLFALKDAFLLSARVLGANQNVLKLSVEGADRTRMDALYFGDPQELLSYLTMRYSAADVNRLLAGRAGGMTLSLAYSPDINEYRGIRSLQLIIQDYM